MHHSIKICTTVQLLCCSHQFLTFSFVMDAAICAIYVRKKNIQIKLVEPIKRYISAPKRHDSRNSKYLYIPNPPKVNEFRIDLICGFVIPFQNPQFKKCPTEFTKLIIQLKIPFFAVLGTTLNYIRR